MTFDYLTLNVYTIPASNINTLTDWLTDLLRTTSTRCVHYISMGYYAATVATGQVQDGGQMPAGSRNTAPMKVETAAVLWQDNRRLTVGVPPFCGDAFDFKLTFIIIKVRCVGRNCSIEPLNQEGPAHARRVRVHWLRPRPSPFHPIQRNELISRLTTKTTIFHRDLIFLQKIF